MSFKHNSTKIQSGNQHDQVDIATKFYSDWLSGSYLILQTSKFLFINVTAMTLGQGHQKVIQYIFPDLYFLCPRYLSFSSNGFDVRSKVFAAAATVTDAAAETNWKPQTGVTYLMVLSMNANDLTEVLHTIGCKVSQGIVC